MMDIIWVVLFVALAGSHTGDGLPVRSTPQTYPHDSSGQTYFEGWGAEHGVYAAVPALLVVLTAVGLLFGCTWCYRHKDCKPNEGAENQLFTASAAHLHDARRNHPPDSGFSEPINNNISEDNNNGPISMREMQNIANNNATAYIVSENEERNRVSRESVVEFEPLPIGIRVVDPLEHCADWFGGEDLPRNRLQYLREIGRGWFGRVVEGELEENGETSTVAVKILDQNASLEDKARFLDEAKMYRDANHENILRYIAKCLQEDPWILIFELCSMDLQQYLAANRPKMAILNERGVPLQLMCDVTSALAHLHSRGHLYGNVWSGAVLIRGAAESARAVLGQYTASEPWACYIPPEANGHPTVHTSESEIWSLGSVLWEVCSWGSTPTQQPPPPPELPCVYRNHLYQVMQLCWHPNSECRPSASQVHALINHLHTTHIHSTTHHDEHSTVHFEERWQTLKPNTIPKIDEHVAIVHAPSTSVASHFTGSDHEFDKSIQDTLSVDMDTAVSRSSSIMSDKDPLSIIKSESLTNLHGSLEDVRNIYLTHNETAVLECHQANIIDDKDNDRSDSSVDPWLKDIIAGSQDDVSYYKDVSDVIKNLDNILNSEKTSSSESSHQASPSRDNLSLDCKRDYPMQSSLVKSPGIIDFQNILEIGFSKPEENELCEEDADRDTIGTLSHSYERHSDTNSQHTLENLTPDTPIKEEITYVESPVPVELTNCETVDVVDKELQATELPKETIESSVSKLPMLKELCLASIPSLSKVKIELNVREDCQTPCDNLTIRTDIVEFESKSVNNTVIEPISSTMEEVIETNTSQQLEQRETIDERNVEEVILPKLIEETIENRVIVEICNNTPHTQEHQPVVIEKIKDNKNEILPKSGDVTTDEKNCVIQSSDLILPDNDTNNSSNLPEDSVILKEVENKSDLPEEMEKSVSIPTQAPESVQNVIEEKSVGTSNNVEVEPEFKSIIISDDEVTATPVLPPDTVQNITEFQTINSLDDFENKDFCTKGKSLEGNEDTTLNEQPMDSTVYVDLVNTNSECVSGRTDNDGNGKDVFKTCLESSATNDCFFVNNESTVYLDLPSVIKEVNDFLNLERAFDSRGVHTSTPKSNDSDNTLEASPEIIDSSGNSLEVTAKAGPSGVSQIKVPDYGPGVTLTMLEQKYVPENMSPFESPTKSHHTDTYDENSSVVLGPFENCTLELFKGVKSELVDFPKEELLAFSANFSEMNLETPSPLRDGNFLNEVPDIVHDDLQFDDVITSSETKPEVESQSNSDNTDKSSTEKRVSPSTPPNSPGIFLASTSQQKYLVDIDLNPPNEVVNETDSGLCSLQKEIDLNQIELQITSKLAMAENENNMNIEYSGPLTVEGLVSEDSETVPESFLAGNGGSIEELRERFTLDEACVKALRNELELKLPLAQVAAIEPQCESDTWSVELPPPPELVVSYPGALSPIAEETGQQLSAYENDVNWAVSIRTESSESYPEPCNSSDEVTDLPTALHSHQQSTYTIHDLHNLTYSVHRDNTSREITLSDDSLNASLQQKADDTSPIEERTYIKPDAESCERISQVSPFMLSPTADTSDVTGVSTLSKTTVPTDAKPSETQCLSKATSIDSWCSNDTLYNVEENFDDLAMDPDLPDFETEKEDNSESSHTLTHNDDEKELSHCSTYIIHDSKSEPCETFSPDSITAHDNGNNTYMKVNTEATGSPSVAKSEANDSTKNSQTKDLAYGTLMSGLPSYSNCTTEALTAGMDDGWNLPQPELVRRSPLTEEINVTPPKVAEKQDSLEESPPITSEPRSKKLDSVDVTCFDNKFLEDVKSENHERAPVSTEVSDNPVHYRNMIQSLTSTPMAQQGEDTGDVDITPIHIPEENQYSSEDDMITLPNLQSFIQSAELREQEVASNMSNDCYTTNPDSGVLLGESKTFSKNSDKNLSYISERSSTYEDFEIAMSNRSGEMHLKEKSSHNLESAMNSEEFLQFENSAKNCPQDLSSLIEVCAMLLTNERRSNELSLGSTNNELIAGQSSSRVEPLQPIVTSPPNDTNLKESQVANVQECNIFLTDFYEEEIKQPLSIIITENPMDEVSENPNETYVDHINNIDLNSSTFNSHSILKEEEDESHVTEKTTLNGINLEAPEICDYHSLIIGISEEIDDNQEPIGIITNLNSEIIQSQDLPNGSSYQTPKCTERKCNGDLEKYATVNFLNETFEELIESNVDDSEIKDQASHENEDSASTETPTKELGTPIHNVSQASQEQQSNGTEVKAKMTTLMEDFLQNEKKFCELDSYLPLLSDIRFSGPAAEIMSTSFSQESPTEATAPECERDSKPNTAADILKEWDSDSESQSSNSSGEFIWKDGDGHETALVPSTHFDHQRGNGPQGEEGSNHEDGDGGGSGGSGDSGSEGDEVEFVPSSWDCRAAPAKSSLRSLEQATPDNKKRVVFKRQKYHCVYEYPREAPELDADSPANYVPDFSTYSEWDPSSVEEAELGYGQLFCSPNPLDVYTLRAGIAFGADYDEDFFISSSARPFESLGIMSTTSQFFPGMHVKPSLLDRDITDDLTDDFPAPPSPLPTPTIVQTRTPSLDFTTPDSGVEDITPGSTSTEEDYKTKKLPEADLSQCWKSVDSASSSESVSPSSPGGETLGGLRHTRDKLKLDLPPSPHISSPRHNRVFNFVLEKPKRNRPVQEDKQEMLEIGTTPLVMTDETPIITTSLPLQKETEDVPLPEPTFSTFGKSVPKIEPEQKIILTDDIQEENEVKEESNNHVKEVVKGEGTVLDSGDEDSGIESSSKATLERKTPNVS